MPVTMFINVQVEPELFTGRLQGLFQPQLVDDQVGLEWLHNSGLLSSTSLLLPVNLISGFFCDFCQSGGQLVCAFWNAIFVIVCEVSGPKSDDVVEFQDVSHLLVSDFVW